jgi:hypothetical protein
VDVSLYRTLTAAALGALLFAGAAAADDKKPKDRATKDDYAIDTSKSSAALEVGEDGKLALVITPKNGTKIHPQAPLEVKLTVKDGVDLEKKKLGRKDIKDAEAKSPELTCGVKGKKKGTHNVEADVSFFLCTDTFCQRMTDRVTIAVKVDDKK